MSVKTRTPPTTTTRRPEQRRYLRSTPSHPSERGPNGAIVFLISAALIAAVGMLYLLQTNHIASLGYEMSRLQEEREAALVEQQQLAAQIAEKQAITQIEVVARNELGMRPMDDYVFLDVTFPDEVKPVGPLETEPEPSVFERFWGRITGHAKHGSQAEEGAGQ